MSMTEEELEAKVKALKFWSGKNSMTLEDIATIQPGLARLMPEVGVRTWKLYYAAKAENWPMAKFQYKEIRGLMELGAFMRPKHAAGIEEYLRDSWPPLEKAIKAEDLPAFLTAFDRAIDDANAWHEKKEKPYIKWKVPDFPPPDLDFEPRKR